jgi:hypothetical protein
VASKSKKIPPCFHKKIPPVLAIALDKRVNLDDLEEKRKQRERKREEEKKPKI